MDFPTAKQLVTEAVARGWCHPENESKVMDTELAEAIVTEVLITLVEARAITR